MIVELVTVLAILGGGSALVRVCGIRGWGLPALGLVAGLSVYISVGAIQAITPITSSPIVTIAVTCGAPLAIWVWYFIRGGDVLVGLVPAGLVVVGTSSLVLFFRSANLVSWSSDTFRYVTIGSLISSDNYDSASITLLPKRLLGVPIMHAAAGLDGEYYLRSITPLIAIAIVVVVAWIVWRGLSREDNRQTLAIIIVAGVLLMVTANRFVFHAFYVNGHLLFGALFLTIVGCSWLLAIGRKSDRKALVFLIIAAIPALVFTRPEASMVIGLAVLPLLSSGAASIRAKSAILWALGLSVIAWQGFLVLSYLRYESAVPFSASGLLVVGVLLLIAIPLLRWKVLTKYGKYLLWAAEGGLWLALIALSLRQADILVDSIRATLHNAVFGAGAWGLSLVVLLVLALAAIFLVKFPAQHYLRFPITTFLPLMFLLAYLREKAYRIGEGDSLNRMWIQVIPLLITFLIVAAASGQWRFRLSRRAKESASELEAPVTPARGAH